VLGAVFIYASLDKQCNPWAFAQAVYNYQVLPDALINLTALILPWLELILGFCLILKRWMMGASSLVAILMTIFMGLMMFNLARGLDINCGYFSTSPEEGSMDKLTLARDGLFLCLAMGLAALTLYKKNGYDKNQIV
jgi:uncharacterized membrane protein YwaF